MLSGAMFSKGLDIRGHSARICARRPLEEKPGIRRVVSKETARCRLGLLHHGERREREDVNTVGSGTVCQQPLDNRNLLATSVYQ